MNLENLAYALTQVVHNFGAVMVVGGAAFGQWSRVMSAVAQQRVLWAVLVGWLLQAFSGLGFGTISYLFYGQFPDIHGIAVAALYLKVTSAILGIGVSIVFLRNWKAWGERQQAPAWTLLVLFGVVALTAAAFLRWFS